MISWLKKLFSKQQKQSWGGSKILWETSFVKVTYVWVEAGRATELYTTQEFSVKNWLFLKGSGDYIVGSMKKKILPGTNTLITSGTKHSIQATNEKVETLEIQFGDKVVQALPSPQPVAQLPPPENKAQ